jgi:tetratricopeptide (TPR) repeat protein
LDLPVLFTTRKLAEKQLASAVFDTYSGLFSGHLGGDRVALPDGMALLGDLSGLARPGPGSISPSQRYRDVERRARNGRSRVQTKALHRAYVALRKHSVVQMHGAVGSGVSTSLKILADHLRLDGSEFYHPPVSIDLRNAHSLEEVHRIACLQVDLAENSLASLITKHTIGFCIDGGDANPELLRELIEQVTLVEGQLRSRFVFGLEEPYGLPGSVSIGLNRLEKHEMRLILRSEVGSRVATQYEPALAIAHPSPGGIYAIVQNIAAGFSPDRVCEILEAGETHSAVADKILSTARLRPLAQVVAVLGSHFPMEIARAILERQLRDQGDSMPIDRFGPLAHEFDRLGVWSEASQHGVDHSYYRLDRSGTYYSVNPGMLEQLRKRTPIADLGDYAGFEDRVADVVLHWLGSPNFPTIAADGAWLTSVAKAMMEWGQIDELSTMASRLVESRMLPSGQSVMPLRINGDPTDVRELLDVLRRATDRTATEWADADMQWLHERCLLFYAETCYKLNEIDAAIDEFGMQVELPGASGNLLVRAHRALGQIAYRAADYVEAKTQFDLAAEQTDVLPRFIVTLNLERSKLELRRGDARDARLRLTTAESLLAADSSAARDKIALERGNVDRLEQDYRAAFERYRALVENERCNPTTRATAAYYLVMIATDRRLLGFNDPVAVAEATSVLDSLVALNRGHELIGILSSCSELLVAASRGATPPQGFDVEMRSVAARMTRGRRLDLLREFQHALEAGASYYVVP